MHNLKAFYVAYPNDIRRIDAEDHIDARERAAERWGTEPVDVWTAREIGRQER